MKRRKFTTTLKQRTCLALDVIKGLQEKSNRNEVIEYLVDEYLKENNLEGIINDMLKKDEEQRD